MKRSPKPERIKQLIYNEKLVPDTLLPPEEFPMITEKPSCNLLTSIERHNNLHHD